MTTYCTCYHYQRPSFLERNGLKRCPACKLAIGSETVLWRGCPRAQIHFRTPPASLARLGTLMSLALSVCLPLCLCVCVSLSPLSLSLWPDCHLFHLYRGAKSYDYRRKRNHHIAGHWQMFLYFLFHLVLPSNLHSLIEKCHQHKKKAISLNYTFLFNHSFSLFLKPSSHSKERYFNLV